jgi:hypothetical protein
MPYKRPYKTSSKSRRAKGSAMSRYKKTGLNKKEVKQVKNIAKKQVNSMAESKYFATNPAIAQTLAVPAWRNGSINSEIGVFGFTTGMQRSNNSDGVSAILRYGANASSGSQIMMTSLDLNRVFTDSNSAPQRASYSVVGSSIRPSYNECTWLVDRVQGNVTNDEEKGLPYKVRMIRVSPRALKGSFQDSDPRDDLFLDAYNEPFGIRTTNASAQNVFGQYEFHMAKVNSRRYRVISDKTLNILPTGTVSNLSTDDVQIMDVNNGIRKMKTTHKIGKELFYSDPNNNSDTQQQYPDTGFTPEFILFHVLACGNAETNSNNRGTADLVKISARPVSTFKDM